MQTDLLWGLNYISSCSLRLPNNIYEFYVHGGGRCFSWLIYKQDWWNHLTTVHHANSVTACVLDLVILVHLEWPCTAHHHPLLSFYWLSFNCLSGVFALNLQTIIQKKLPHCVKNINKIRMQWFANHFWPKFTWMQYSSKIFHVQTDTFVFSTVWIWCLQHYSKNVGQVYHNVTSPFHLTTLSKRACLIYKFSFSAVSVGIFSFHNSPHIFNGRQVCRQASPIPTLFYLNPHCCNTWKTLWLVFLE